MDPEGENMAERTVIEGGVYEGDNQLGSMLTDSAYVVGQVSEADMMAPSFIVQQQAGHGSGSVHYVLQAGEQQQYVTLTQTEAATGDQHATSDPEQQQQQQHYMTLAPGEEGGGGDAGKESAYDDVYRSQEGNSVMLVEGGDEIAKAYLASSVKGEEGLLGPDQQVLGSELIPGATLPTEFLQFSSQPDHPAHDIDDSKRKEILIGDVFHSASASLTAAFLDYVTLTRDPNYLETVGHEFDVILQQTSQAISYHGKVAALQRLERHFLNVLFGPVLPANSTSAETQTDPVVIMLGDDNSNDDKSEGKKKTNSSDKSVMCDIPRPLFSRSGRQLKIKAELYESDIEESGVFDVLPESSPSAAKSAEKSATEQGATVTGKRRGRPPKKKPKMIHVDQDTKKVTIKDSATGDAVLPAATVIDKNEKLVDSHVVANAPVVQNAAESDYEQESKANIIPEAHQQFLKKCLVPAIELNNDKATPAKVEKKAYEDQMPFKYFCDICSFKTKRKSHLDKHKAIHTRKKLPLYQCDLCSFKTMRSGHLSRHLLKHSDNVFSCGQCDYKTINRLHMRTHMKKKHNAAADTMEQENESVQVLSCEICGYKTERESVMKRHLRVHDDGNTLVPVFECKLCPYKSLKKMHYTRHMVAVHSEKRPYLCDTCGRGFKRNDALTQHRLIHMDKSLRRYPYYCSDCAKGFRSPAHLKEHMTIHSSARPFLCDICGACFKTKSVQRKHTATLHSNPRAHQCPTCRRRFNTAFTLRRHMKSHTDDDGDGAAAGEMMVQQEVVSGGITTDGGVSSSVVSYNDGMSGGGHHHQAEILTTSSDNKQQEYSVQEVVEAENAAVPMQMQIIGGTGDDQVVQMLPESLYLQQGSTVQIVTQNEMGGVEQVQMVMIQQRDDNAQVIETSAGTEAETLLYLTSLPNMQSGIDQGTA